MGFTAGNKILADIVEEIAVGLIASTGGYWTDADATWTTTTKTENNARRALKYENGTEIIYLALEAINETNGLQLNYTTWGSCSYGGYTYNYAKGIRITCSLTWDSVKHFYPLSVHTVFIPYETYGIDYGWSNWGNCCNWGNTVYGYTTTDISNTLLSLDYWLWIDANGFALMGRPIANSTDPGQQSFIAVIERIPTKEFTDEYTNFFGFFQMNYNNPHRSSYADINRARMKTYVHYFDTYYPIDTTDSSNAASGPYYGESSGIIFPRLGENPVSGARAIKNSMCDKVYYMKPIACNSRDSRCPIAEFNSFFAWSDGMGLQDGDIVQIDGETTKYLCKLIDSPDYVNKLPFAIKMVA